MIPINPKPYSLFFPTGGVEIYLKLDPPTRRFCLNYLEKYQMKKNNCQYADKEIEEEKSKGVDSFLDYLFDERPNMILYKDSWFEDNKKKEDENG